MAHAIMSNLFVSIKIMEAATGFEPVIKVLQTFALPLGHAAHYYLKR